MENSKTSLSIICTLLFILNSIVFSAVLFYNDLSKDAWRKISNPPDIKPIEGSELKCKALKYGCEASEKFYIVCGSDMKNYWNPGVFACAQKCSPVHKLRVLGFTSCKSVTTTIKPLPMTEETTTPKAQVTTPPIEIDKNSNDCGPNSGWYFGFCLEDVTSAPLQFNDNPSIHISSDIEETDPVIMSSDVEESHPIIMSSGL